MLNSVTSQVTLGTGTKARVWNRREAFRDLLPELTRSPAGEKDGACFTPATFRGIRRTKTDADEIGVAVLDSDCGHELHEIAAAIATAGYEALIHSTHSHLVAQTKVECSELEKSGGDVVAHMRKKGFLPRIIENTQIIGTTEDGKYSIVEHAPCPKYRILIPLARPWRAAAYETQDAANLEWRNLTRALAASLGLSTDQSCCDTSRLFFLPRTRKDGPPFKYRHVEGRQCDMQEALAAAPNSGARQPNGPAPDFDHEELLSWASTFGPAFEIVTALRTRKPKVIIRPNGAKTTIQCPFEGQHTDPGGEGCFAINASDLPHAGLPSVKSGFFIKCMHSHCAGRDRLDFVAEMLDQGWLAYEDLTAPAFLAGCRAGADRHEGTPLYDFYAYRLMHNFIYIPSGDLWPAASVNEHVPPVQLYNKKGEPRRNADGSLKKMTASAWLARYRFVQQLTWAPGEARVIHGRIIKDGGWIPCKDGHCFNLYQPPPEIKGDPALAGRWVELVRRVYPDNADHIIMYAAHRVQRPGEKINHALFLGGSPGIGKDSIVEPIKLAVGPWNFGEASPQDMFGAFTKVLRSVILRVSEGRDLGDVDRFKLYDKMKVIIAAPPDVLKINEKNMKEYYVANICSVIITSNYKTDGIYLPEDDRRHYVAWSELTREEFSKEFWDDLWRWYDHGGAGHVAAYLAALDLSSFNAKAPPFKTAAFYAIADTGRPPEIPEALDVLDELGSPNAVTLDELRAKATGEFKLWLDERKNRRAIPHRLEKCGYIPVRNPDAQDGLWKVEGKRQTIYGNRKLPLKEQIEAAYALTCPNKKKEAGK